MGLAATAAATWTTVQFRSTRPNGSARTRHTARTRTFAVAKDKWVPKLTFSTVYCARCRKEGNTREMAFSEDEGFICVPLCNVKKES